MKLTVNRRQANPMHIGLPTLLGVLFIGLKLGGVISWSWWWVLAPFWLLPVIGVVVLFVITLASTRR